MRTVFPSPWPFVKPLLNSWLSSFVSIQIDLPCYVAFYIDHPRPTPRSSSVSNRPSNNISSIRIVIHTPRRHQHRPFIFIQASTTQHPSIHRGQARPEANRIQPNSHDPHLLHADRSHLSLESYTACVSLPPLDGSDHDTLHVTL